MINKIKDFLGKLLRRKRSEDLSDQDDFYEEVDLPESASREEGTRWKTLTRQLPTLGGFKLPSLGKRSGAPLISPSLSRNIEKILSRSSREHIHQIGLVALVFAGTYTAGKITALALKGKPPTDVGRQVVVSIPVERNFNPMSLNQVQGINPFKTNVAPTTKRAAETRCEVAQQRSSLPIELLNTTVLQDSVKSLASVQVRGERGLKEVREGDQISNMAKVFKIDRLELVVRNLQTNACESIASTKLRERAPAPMTVLSPAQSRAFLAGRKMPGIENEGNKFNISRNLLDEKMKDIGNILTQVRAVKIQNPDGSLSFKLTEMDPEGLFPYLGLQDGDIISSINGKPIYDMNEIMSRFGNIKNLDNLQLGISREGTESVQEYSIKK